MPTNANVKLRVTNKLDNNELWVRTYCTVINLEPFVLNSLDITYIVTRKCSIHDIQVNHHSIKPVYRWFITCPAHTSSQVKNLRKPNRLVKLSKFTRLQKSRNVSNITETPSRINHHLRVIKGYLKPLQCYSKNIRSLQYGHLLFGSFIRSTSVKNLKW